MIIDGKSIAAKLREDVKAQVARMPKKPGLAVVLVGENPASQVYVKNKLKACQEAGIASFDHTLPASISQAELLVLIAKLNADKNVHGILVQLPLPNHIDPHAVIEAIDPKKDVDGFHPANIGELILRTPRFVPCTPLGCLKLLQSLNVPLAGKHAVVLGRSNIVGKPMAALLLQQDCTVTVVHSKTADVPAHIKQADIVVAAIGQPEFVRGAWLKPGAIVLDVGINRLDNGTLIGDVAFDEAKSIASAITPVPGGVGPMTIACLLENTLKAARVSAA